MEDDDDDDDNFGEHSSSVVHILVRIRCLVHNFGAHSLSVVHIFGSKKGLWCTFDEISYGEYAHVH